MMEQPDTKHESLVLPKLTKKLEISDNLTGLMGTVSFTEEEINSDPRLKALLGKQLAHMEQQLYDDDSLVGEEDFFARIDVARKSIADGKGTSAPSTEDLDSLLASL